MSVEILVGDALSVLRTLPSESVHCCVTSPPYYGLRDYGVAGQIGLEPTPAAYIANLVEIMRGVRRVLRADGTLWLNIGDSYAGSWGARGRGPGTNAPRPDLEAKYGTHAPNRTSFRPGNPDKNQGSSNRDGCGSVVGCKAKDLIGIPWMLAFALRDDGWYLRRDIIWHKPNPMPESVTDRPTAAHEYLFLLTKSGTPTYWTHRDHEGSTTKPVPDYRWQQTDDYGKIVSEQDFEPAGFRKDWPHWKRINLWDGHDYFYDAEAIKEPFATDPKENYPGRAAILGRGSQASSQAPLGSARRDNTGGYPPNGGGRNKRSVWAIATAPFKGAHFATFPPGLVEPCILAGTSERGVCPKCGAPWERVVETRSDDRVPYATIGAGTKAKASRNDGSGRQKVLRQDGRGGDLATTQKRTVGWRATCDHAALNPVRATMLDPFFGAGTTGLVAQQQGRDCIGIELNTEYAAMARRRIDGKIAAAAA